MGRSQEVFLRYARQGFAVNYANILVLLTRLRQACVHPFLSQSAVEQCPVAAEGSDEEGEEAPAAQSMSPRMMFWGHILEIYAGI